MAGRPHKIRRQVVEISARDEATGRLLEREIGRIHATRIVPLIDRCCSEAGDPEHVYRIDSLQVDLGWIDPQDFAGDLTRRLEVRLPEALSASIRRRDAAAGGLPSDVAARRELVVVFARTGNLPWWADADRPALIAESIRILLQRAPAVLRETLRELAGEAHHLRRLALSLGGDEISELVGALAPAVAGVPAGLPGSLAGRLLATGELGGESAPRLRITVRQAMIEAACAGGEPLTSSGFWGQVLGRIAAASQAEYGALVTGLRREIRQRRLTTDAGLVEIVEALHGELPRERGGHDAADVSEGALQGLGVDEIRRLLDGHKERGGSLARLFAALHGAADRLDDRERMEWLKALRQLGDPGGPLDLRAPAIAHHLGRLLRPALRRRLLPASILQRCRDELDAATLGVAGAATVVGRDGPPATPLRELLDAAITEVTAQTPVTAQRQETGQTQEAAGSVDTSFSESERLYVESSGLVILWPFFERFFERLGLLTDRRLRDVESVARAAGLLHHLVSGDPLAPEYALGLNKVLCGIHPLEVVELSAPVTAAEAEEAENLLGAALAHAPGLGSLSIDGLRGSFLVRSGLLGAGDGAWLLQVERRSFDVVLDRLPWSISWVSLPWMDVPLRVEW